VSCTRSSGWDKVSRQVVDFRAGMCPPPDKATTAVPTAVGSGVAGCSTRMEISLKSCRPTSHSSVCSASNALNSRNTASRLGKMPTTVLRRVSSLFSRSHGLVL
jgi:hypothetical protein